MTQNIHPPALRRGLCAAVFVAILAGVVPGEALAQTPSATTQHAFRISAGTLDDALRQFTAQSGLQVLYDSALLKGVNSMGFDGTAASRSVLDKLLGGTGLAYEFTDSGTVVIKRGAPRRAKPKEKDDKSAKVPSEEAPVEMEKVSVTGSRLTSAESEQALEKIVIDRKAIDASGATSIAEVLNALPEVSRQSTTAPYQNSRGGSYASLRGLPVSFTLTLINGRRIGYGGNTGSSALNLSLLPLAAVDRIEVLPAGSAAVYGGSALAGVVNIVLKDHLQGGEISIGHGSADGYDDSTTNLGWGWNSERFSILLGGTYRSNTELQASERSITANTDYSRFGGHVALSPYATPGNVYSLDGKPLPGLTSTFAGIPRGQDGTRLTIADFAATDGVLNTNSTFYSTAPVIPVSKQYSGFLSAKFRATENIELFTEYFYSHYEAEESDYPPYLYGQYGTFVVAANNPYNPFGVPLGINYLFKGARQTCYCIATDYTRGLLGARGEFGGGWRWEVAAIATRNEEVETDSLLDAAKVNAALAQTDPALALNPFADRTWSKTSLDPYFTNLVYPTTTTFKTLNGFVSGPLFDFGAGQWEAVFGAEYERDHMNYGYYKTFFQNGYDVKSAFVELSAPLIASRGPEGAGAMLAVTGALRYDDYSTFGGRLSPQVGLQFRPTTSLLLRANYSSAYKPPTLNQLYAPQTTYPGSPVVDPKRGGETYAATTIQGGNPSLQALTGNSKTYGFVYSPEWRPGLELSATGFKIHTDNYATTLGAQAVINNESLFPGSVVRASPTADDIAKGYAGHILTVNYTYKNFGTFDVAGADFDVSWRLSTDCGDFKPSLAATYTYQYKYQLAPGSAPVETVGQANNTGYAPRWKAAAIVAWQRDAWQATLTGRYVGPYKDYDDGKPTTPARTLGNFWLFDANVRYDFGRDFAPESTWLSKAYATLGGVNIFNKLPVYSYLFGTVGYDPSQYDIRGRYLYVQLGTRF